MSKWSESAGRESLMKYFSHAVGQEPLLEMTSAGIFGDEDAYSAVSEAVRGAIGSGKFLVLDQKKLVELPNDPSFVFD